MATDGPVSRAVEIDRFQSWVGKQHWAAWVISGIGLALAGLSLWYLIIVKSLFIGSAADGGVLALVLKVIEVTLLAGFSLVLVYGGYWLVSSPFDKDDLWWTGMWTLIGLAGVVALVALATAFQIMNEGSVSQPTLIQEMLLAAGGGGLAGLLIGVSTVRETIEGERAKRQRNTLLFVNELLRHNVLNGMQVITGNADLLRDHVDDRGEELLDATEERADDIVALIQDVRALMKSVSGETPCHPVLLSAVLRQEVHATRASHPDVTVEASIPDGVEVWADDLLDVVFENLLGNAVKHGDDDGTHITVAVEERDTSVVVEVADDGPGIPEEIRDVVFEPGEQGEGNVGEGLGLYLVDLLLERYGGEVALEDNHPRGTVAVVELPTPEAV